MKLNNLIRIVIVGDFSIFRSGLKMLLEAENMFKVVGELSKISEIFSLPAPQKPDLILVDLPEDGSRSDLFSFLTQSHEKINTNLPLANTPILVLTSSRDLETYNKCLRLGVNGLVLKEKNTDTLFKAIEKVCQGEFWFDRSLMGKTIRQLMHEKKLLHENPRNGAHDDLTDRENQVVNLICKGLKNRDIADKLFITETTVRHHLSSIFEKLGLASRLELVIYAFKHNLVKIPSPFDSHSGNGSGRVRSAE